MKKFSKRDLKRQINGDLPSAQNSANGTTSADSHAQEKRRLDELVFEKYPQYSHNSLRIAIRDGLVTVIDASETESSAERNTSTKTKPSTVEQIESKVAEVILDPTTLLSPHATVSLNLPEKLPPPPPDIIFENENVLVINKPAGLLSIIKGDFCFEPSVSDYGQIIHRLDRATSGVMILAKNQSAQKLLQRQFNQRTAHKTYYAIVSGVPKIPKAKIDLPIARDFNHPTTFKVAPNGRPAQTYYELIATNNRHSLLKLQPITGRTHQLRVHLKHIGYPIVGDTVYGNEKPTSKKSSTDKSQKPRLFLHATFLEITIPTQAPQQATKNIRKTFFAPLPPEFTAEFPCEPDSSRIGQPTPQTDKKSPSQQSGESR